MTIPENIGARCRCIDNVISSLDSYKLANKVFDPEDNLHLSLRMKNSLAFHRLVEISGFFMSN